MEYCPDGNLFAQLHGTRPKGASWLHHQDILYGDLDIYISELVFPFSNTKFWIWIRP